MTQRGAAARLAVGAAVAGLVLVAAGLRLAGDGRAALSASDAALAQDDVALAVVHARSAARAYVPFAAHAHGLQKLRDIAQKSERGGDTEAALFAWRAVLSVATSTRPFGAVADETRAEAEASVARLAAEIRTRTRAGSAVKRADDAEALLASAGVVPRIGWAAAIVLGAGLWWAAALRLTSRGFTTDGRLAVKQVGIAGAMALAGLLGWLTGLWLA